MIRTCHTNTMESKVFWYCVVVAVVSVEHLANSAVTTHKPVTTKPHGTTHHVTTKPHGTTHHATTTRHQNHHSHKTHAPREPNEMRFYAYFYDAYSHFMALKLTIHGQTPTCYIYLLNHDEQMKVHHPTGIYEIEAKLLQLSLSKTDPFDYDEILLKTHTGFRNFCTKSMKLIKLN